MTTTKFRQVPYEKGEVSLSVNERVSSDHLVICIHGLGCSKESFDGLFTNPSLNGYSLCAIDLPGHGKSDKPEDFSYSMEKYAKTVGWVIDQIQPKRLSVAAHSMGGAIGVLLAQAGFEFESFVSIEGNLVGEDCGYVSRRIVDQTFQQFSEKGLGELLATLQVSERLAIQTWASWLTQATPQALYASARSLVEWSDSKQLLDIFNGFKNKAYIHGDEDDKGFLLPHLQATQVISVSSAGHFCMIDNPQDFESAIVQTLS